MKPCLLGQSEVPYPTLASEMKTSEGALKVAVHRLRKRYRELLRQEIADTGADPADVAQDCLVEGTGILPAGRVSTMIWPGDPGSG